MALHVRMAISRVSISSSQDASFLHDDLAGNHVCINPPAAQVSEYVQHYMDCKSKDPFNISACIMVPKGRDMPWQKLLDGMQLLAEYMKGDKKFLMRMLMMMLFVHVVYPVQCKCNMMHPRHV